MNKLEYLNCEGCEKLSDNAFKYLHASINFKTNSETECLKKELVSDNLKEITNQLIQVNDIDENINRSENKSECNECIKINNIEDLDINLEITMNRHDKCLTLSNGTNRLKYINLSGCWSITDYGLG